MGTPTLRMFSATFALAAACGGAPSLRTLPPSPQPEDISLETATVARGRIAPEGSNTQGDTSTAAKARAALDAVHAHLLACYESTLHQIPEALGRLHVDVAFGPNGAVQRVQARPDQGATGLGVMRGCVEDALRRARMTSAPPAGARVRRSYSFINPPVEITVQQGMVVTPRRPSSTVRPSATGAQPGGGAVAGPLTAAEVEATVQGAAPALSACFSSFLRANRNAQGDFGVDMHVAPDGTVIEATAGVSDVSLEGISDCVLSAMRALRFRASGSPATVHYTLRFQR